MSAQAIGRLSRGPHPVLFELLYEPHFASDKAQVLPHLLRIDAAHVVMLARRGILAPEPASRLLALNRELARRLASGEELFPPPPSHRGLYLLYEGEYIARLGGEVGGAAHVARSRNDINATVTRMRLRPVLAEVLRQGLLLASQLERLGGEHAQTLMSAFTHLQPAQPATFGHYLGGVLSELLRTLDWIAGAHDTLNRCPMGAAAGVGTSFPIDTTIVAELLGFDGPLGNSLDAVGSRDYVVQVLSGLALLGTLLTRMSADFQTWASSAYGFLGWPDELVSTSSIMPQKRNAFVLENIRGQAVKATGFLMNALMGLKSTSFTNSVEVSSEATSPVWPALETARTALVLMELLVSNLIVHPEPMRRFLVGQDTTMTALADHLVARHGLAFRTAHDVVGRLVNLKREPELTPQAARGLLEPLLATTLGRDVSLNEAELAQVLDPEGCVRAAAYGGGPAPEAVRAHLAVLGQARERLQQRVQGWKTRLDAADDALAAASAAGVSSTA
ncbi:argininosuccinate lyase [Stigmatella sp. ncwal1]|uniref:Argininosuccinate lyase n=1 Tax=Stigmatella ashevillensis TaxID=2995309 RepID=A0ABT5D3E9_9BACT|nr:argininosuccinate lyase [Stigmatella ashevillena]MDC0708190.1 argininosuccinate lyase [Stigmatella ashevillena]